MKRLIGVFLAIIVISAAISGHTEEPQLSGPIGNLASYTQYTPEELFKMNQVASLAYFAGIMFERDSSFKWNKTAISRLPAVVGYVAGADDQMGIMLLNANDGLYRVGLLDFSDGNLWTYGTTFLLNDENLNTFIENNFPDTHRNITSRAIKQAEAELKQSLAQQASAPTAEPEETIEGHLVPTTFFYDYTDFKASELILLDEEYLSSLAICVGHYFSESTDLFEWAKEYEGLSAIMGYDETAGQNQMWFFMYNKIDQKYWVAVLDFDRGNLWTYWDYAFSEDEIFDIVESMFPTYLKGANAETVSAAWKLMTELDEQMIP